MQVIRFTSAHYKDTSEFRSEGDCYSGVCNGELHRPATTGSSESTNTDISFSVRCQRSVVGVFSERCDSIRRLQQRSLRRFGPSGSLVRPKHCLQNSQEEWRRKRGVIDACANSPAIVVKIYIWRFFTEVGLNLPFLEIYLYISP
jgi:hypothetical protein